MAYSVSSSLPVPEAQLLEGGRSNRAIPSDIDTHNAATLLFVKLPLLHIQFTDELFELPEVKIVLICIVLPSVD